MSLNDRDPKKLIQSVKASGKCPQLVFISGPDRVRREKFITLLADLAFQKATTREIRRVAAQDIEQNKLGPFIENLNSLSLFSPFRFVVVDAAENLTANTSASLSAFFKEPHEGICCVFSAQKASGQNALVKLAQSQNVAAEFANLEGSELATWIGKELKAAEIKEFESGIEQALAHLGDDNPDRIAQFIRQLALYVGDGRASLADLQTLFKESLDAREFDFIDALLDKKAIKAEQLNSLLQRAGKNVFGLLTLIQRQYTTLLAVQALASKGLGAEEIARELKIQPWLAKKHIATLRTQPRRQLQTALLACLKAEALLKNRNLGTEMVVSGLIHDILPLVGKPQVNRASQ